MKFALLAAFLLLAGCSGGNDPSISASGTIEGTDINVGAEVAGRVAQVRVEEGSRVRPGDTLVVIDDQDYAIQLRQALANLASVDATYRIAVEGSRKEDILQAEVAYKTAEADYARMKDLLASQTITRKQYDDSYARYVAAEQTYNKVKNWSRPEEIVAAREKRDLAAAQADLLRKKIRDCRITAPSAGTVTLKAVEPGELVTPGMNVIRLTYLDRVKLMIYVNESELGRIHLGDKAQVTVDSDPKRKFEGTVVYLSPNAEFTPKNVQTKDERTKLVFGVKLEVPNPDGALKPGLPADAVISLSGKTQG